ncbi:hypothetical protein D9615_006210 [Tricholomella constricta]|uniref:Glutathione S-transferase n=1 Tax=Tricholomella constricta TaxID=117010 RepID=A0A8H5HBH0_9AGAR|nr:hypothetical protein D9615_006210 [Tricholomella constricta]
MTQQVTLYTAKICPYAHRVELALEESGIAYNTFEVDLTNKPEWYAPQVNPASKVPALAYGGPAVDPSQPSSESAKIAESLVLLEFVADISGTRLLPQDPVLRAKARFFIDTVSNTVAPAFPAVIARGEPVERMLTAIEKVQALLPAEGFAVGPEFSIADAALVPFLARAEVILKNDCGAFDEGTGLEAYETLSSDPKFARYRKYFGDIKARESFKKTFQGELIRSKFTEKTTPIRAQRKAQATSSQ